MLFSRPVLLERIDNGAILKKQEMFKQFLVDIPSEEQLQDTRKLLEEYSRIEPDDVLSHIIAVVCSPARFQSLEALDSQ